MKNTLLVLAALGLIGLAGCGAPKPPVSAEARPAAVPAEAKILDVRTPQEYQSGHLQDAVNVPVDEVAQRIAGLVPDKATPLVVYCRSGRRSAAAKATLEKLGYSQVKDLGSITAARQALPGR